MMYKYMYAWCEGGSVYPIYLRIHPKRLLQQLTKRKKIRKYNGTFVSGTFASGIYTAVYLARGIYIHAIFTPFGERWDAESNKVTEVDKIRYKYLLTIKEL